MLFSSGRPYFSVQIDGSPELLPMRKSIFKTQKLYFWGLTTFSE